MPAPAILNVTRSSNNIVSGTWTFTYPAYSSGDLIVFCMGSDDTTEVTFVTAPAGPNGETLNQISIQNPGRDETPNQRESVWWYIATSGQASSSLAFTPSASETWAGVCFRVAAGDFDATTPIGATLDWGVRTITTYAETGTFTAGYNDGGGLLVVWGCVDSYGLNTTPTSGWTYLENFDGGDIGTLLATRTADVTNDESVPTYQFNIVGTSTATSSTLAFIIRQNIGILSVDSVGYGALSAEFDYNDSAIDINGKGFGASIGSSKVYLSEDSTLAAGITEVDITSAVSSWSDTTITVNLSATNLRTALDALIVPNLYIIADIGPGTEYRFKVKCHRAKAFAMANSGNVP